MNSKMTRRNFLAGTAAAAAVAGLAACNNGGGTAEPEPAESVDEPVESVDIYAAPAEIGADSFLDRRRSNQCMNGKS